MSPSSHLQKMMFAVAEYSDEEVIVESDDGIDPEEQRLREGDGYMMNLVESYTMPIAEGDSESRS